MGTDIAVIETKKPNKHPAVRQLLEEYAPENWLTPNEVAQIFRVDPKTVIRWRNGDKFKVTDNGVVRDVRTFRTPGNHTRFFAPDIKLVMDENEYRPKN